MRFRVRLLSILSLSLIGFSALSAGCWDNDSDSEDDGGAGKSGKGGSGAKAGSAGTGGDGGTAGAAGNGPWPSFGQPVNGECGLPPTPRWGFELYEAEKRVAIPSRGPKDIDVMGMVTEVGDGTPEDLGRSDDEADVRYVRVQASSHAYTLVSYGAPGFGAMLSPGTEVSLSHHDDTCDVLCPPGNIGTALRSGEKDLIRYVFTSKGEPMLPEGFAIAFGEEELCEGRTSCVAWTGHMLEVTSPSGVKLEFTPGEADELGDYTIYAGISRRFKEKNDLESTRNMCADSWTYSPKELLFVRTQ